MLDHSLIELLGWNKQKRHFTDIQKLLQCKTVLAMTWRFSPRTWLLAHSLSWKNCEVRWTFSVLWIFSGLLEQDPGSFLAKSVATNLLSCVITKKIACLCIRPGGAKKEGGAWGLPGDWWQCLVVIMALSTIHVTLCRGSRAFVCLAFHSNWKMGMTCVYINPILLTRNLKLEQGNHGETGLDSTNGQKETVNSEQ